MTSSSPNQTLPPPHETPSSNNLYQEESVDPARLGGAKAWDITGNTYFEPGAPAEGYDRGLEGYARELDGTFTPEEWIGGRVLDIGAGAYDRFGHEAREKGINVVSINPALKDEKHRDYLKQALEATRETRQHAADQAFEAQPLWRRMFRRVAEVSPEQPRVVEALAQNLPFASSSFDAVVSVYGVPHYLHHVDAELTDDKEILDAYTPAVREQDKVLIRQSFGEILRVLKPGGKAFLTDDHRAPNQTTKINSFSPSDGTEVKEILAELEGSGVSVEVREHELDFNRGIKRIIVLQKPALQNTENVEQPVRG